MALFDVGRQDVKNSKLLIDRFIVPPFSVFDARQGYWQTRKKSWIGVGIKSELGRDSKLTRNLGCYNYEDEKLRLQELKEFGESKLEEKSEQTSIFDPVLCEVLYRWFTRVGDDILDPFAGGSVRGIVAGALQRYYTGIDLSERQIKANIENYKEIDSRMSGIIEPTWIVGDSLKVTEELKGMYDFIFSCPPYFNLEVYSDDPNDLSNMKSYEDFLLFYNRIIHNCCELLNDDCFAVFVVGNIRDLKTGGYYDLAGDTVRAFTKEGLLFYNDALLLNAVGTLSIRAPRQFNVSRKLGKQHQNVLCFYKGDQKNIKTKFGKVEEGLV